MLDGGSSPARRTRQAVPLLNALAPLLNVLDGVFFPTESTRQRETKEKHTENQGIPKLAGHIISKNRSETGNTILKKHFR